MISADPKTNSSRDRAVRASPDDNATIDIMTLSVTWEYSTGGDDGNGSDELGADVDTDATGLGGSMTITSAVVVSCEAGTSDEVVARARAPRTTFSISW